MVVALVQVNRAFESMGELSLSPCHSEIRFFKACFFFKKQTHTQLIIMSHHHHTTNNIKIAFLLNLSFTLLEIIGGLWTNSVAILSDALHDLGDTVALGLSWHLANVSQKKRDSQFSYGYKRFSLIGALISSIILLLGSVIILSEAIPRLFHPENVYVEGMILFAIFGVLVNGVAALRLRGGQDAKRTGSDAAHVGRCHGLDSGVGCQCGDAICGFTGA